jgi:hypothetical protein
VFCVKDSEDDDKIDKKRILIIEVIIVNFIVMAFNDNISSIKFISIFQ